MSQVNNEGQRERERDDSISRQQALKLDKNPFTGFRGVYFLYYLEKNMFLKIIVVILEIKNLSLSIKNSFMWSVLQYVAKTEKELRKKEK